jgi:hypothetical protein
MGGEEVMALALRSSLSGDVIRVGPKIRMNAQIYVFSFIVRQVRRGALLFEPFLPDC